MVRESNATKNVLRHVICWIEWTPCRKAKANCAGVCSLICKSRCADSDRGRQIAHKMSSNLEFEMQLPQVLPLTPAVLALLILCAEFFGVGVPIWQASAKCHLQ